MTGSSCGFTSPIRMSGRCSRIFRAPAIAPETAWAMTITLISLPRSRQVASASSAVAAVSVGILDGEARLDLEYTEDSIAEVDMNVVRIDDDRYVEVQGTAEGGAFSRGQLSRIITLAVRLLANMFADHMVVGVWLLLVPFRLVGIAVEGVLAFVKALIFLPARILRA